MGDETDHRAAAPDFVGVVIEFKVVDADNGVVVFKRLGATEDGPDARDHFVQAEGLGDVVVAADGQSGDLVLGVILGREEKDREVLARCAEASGYGEAVHVREHDVQYGEVRSMGVRSSKRFATIGRCNDLETCETQRRGEKLTDVGFVVNNKELGFGAVLFMHP